MRKQNHSIAPVLKHNSGPNNSVVFHHKHKRPNALKHGVFARPFIIPGEDLSEFQELYAELIDEWQAFAPTLRDAVSDLADSKWRKRRLQRFVQTRLSLCTFDPDHPAFTEVWGFSMFIHHLRTKPETCFEEHARKYLSADRINDLKQKFPRSGYQSSSQWAEAVISEILSVPTQIELADESELEKAAREWVAEQKVAGSIICERELLEYEFKETERLDSKIRQQIKFLIELKTMQKMLCET
jgi:hypothetical protein